MIRKINKKYYEKIKLLLLKLDLNLFVGFMKSWKFWKENFFIYFKQDFYNIKRTDSWYNNAPYWTLCYYSE